MDRRRRPASRAAAWRAVAEVSLLMGLVAVPVDAALAQGGAVTVALVLDGPAGRMADVRERLQRELSAVMGPDRPVRVDADPAFLGDWTADGIREAIRRALSSPDADLVVVFGVVGPRIIAQLGPLPKPTVAGVLVDRFAFALPDDSAAAADGLYFAGPQFSRPPAFVFRDVFRPRRIAVIVPAALAEVSPRAPARALQEMGLDEAWIVPASADPRETAARIPEGADGVYLLPVQQWTDADVRTFAEALVDRRLPSFSWVGGREVELGILAAATGESLSDRLPRWVAVTVEALSRERPAGVVPSAFLLREQLTLNRVTLERVGVSPRWRALVDAQFVGADTLPTTGRLTLPGAIAAALEANLDLTAAGRGVEAGAATVRLARAPLLPQIGVSASTRWMGGNIFAAAQPYASSGALSGNAGFSMPLYDDRTWANYSVQRSLQQSREYVFGSQQLDVARAAAVTYLGLLGQRTLQRIQRANADLTRSNLEIARIRETTGGGRLAEVYRWQTQLAQAQDALVRTATDAALVEQELNRLLDRPLTNAVDAADVAVDDPSLQADAARIATYLDTPRSFETFRAFLVTEAMEASPELRALDAQVAAYERQRTAANRAFWLPSFSLEAGGLYRFSQWGDTRSTGGSGLWTFAVVGRYPLFTGLSRFAESDRASLEQERIVTEREATRQRVDQRVGAAALNLRGAVVALEVAQEAAEAARRNYALTDESYREGVGAIIMVLDAQTAALTAELRAASAAYEVLVGLADLQRAVGRFDVYGTAEARDAFFARLEAFFADAGVEVQR